LQKVLEGTNLKLSSVATKIQGASAQAILHARLEGQSDPAVLADLAQGSLRHKRDQLERALKGTLSAHQRFMLSDLLVLNLKLKAIWLLCPLLSKQRACWILFLESTAWLPRPLWLRVVWI
jgi:hypothetical protein